MAKQQEPLPLGVKPSPTSDPGPSLAELLKKADRARRVLAAQVKKGEADLTVQDVEKLITALQSMETNRVLSELERQRVGLATARKETLARRREDLERAAKAAGWKIRRFQRYDYVDCFGVYYKQEKVTIKLGSEDLFTVSEVNGSRLLSTLQTQKQQLDALPFDRAEFFATLKAAISLARVLGRDRDGKVLVRDLHPLVVLVRQSGNQRFIKRPTHKCFTEYPMPQFAYDLARFGRDGWMAGRGERLSNQPPNMASITKGVTVTLPPLGGGKGEQICALYIQRAQG